jgi:hypothetical protein
MSNRILSYRGLLVSGGQDTILLSTKKGEIGYRITKMQLMPWIYGGGSSEQESVVKVYKDFQSSISEIIDFSDNRLLGAGIVNNDDSGEDNATRDLIVFDYEIFNQDIYVTHVNQHADGAPCNYYLELEVIKLDESQAMVATLKDIRNNS